MKIESMSGKQVRILDEQSLEILNSASVQLDHLKVKG